MVENQCSSEGILSLIDSHISNKQAAIKWPPLWRFQALNRYDNFRDQCSGATGAFSAPLSVRIHCHKASNGFLESASKNAGLSAVCLSEVHFGMMVVGTKR